MPRPFSAIPGPKGLPIIGSLLDYSRFGRHSFERMHLAKLENQQKYGKIYKEKTGRPMVQLFDPVDIEKVFRADGKFPIRPPLPITLVASKRNDAPLSFGSMNGEPWWRIRKAIHRTMMPPSAAFPYLPVQNKVADEFVKVIIREVEKNGDGRLREDVTTFLSKYTMEAFGAVCFDARIGCLEQAKDKESLSSKAIKSINDVFHAMQQSMDIFPTYAFYRTKLYEKYVTSQRACRGMAHTYVDGALKKDDGQKSKNFLQTLVDSHSDRLTMDEMVDTAIDLFTAGVDSTAYALSFCLYNLASNVEKQNRLIEEVDSVLGAPSPDSTSSIPPVTAEVLNELPYLKACVKESFRLNFPVEGGTGRELNSDLVLSDYHIPKGTLVRMNHQTMCLMEEYFEYADQYLPERWLKDGSSATRPVNSFVMLPFGYGSRMCIGRRFAEQEIYLALIKVFHRFRLRLDDAVGKDHKIGMLNRLFTMPDGPIPLRFIPRS